MGDLRAALRSVAVLGLACAAGCGREPAPAALAFPSGSSAPEVRVEAALDLGRLRAVDDGEGLVAAARFEPAGTTLPSGTRITWSLAGVRPPGERLHVVVLDEAQGRWVDTGETAEVDVLGRVASGPVHHLSTVGLSRVRPRVRDGEVPPPPAASPPEPAAPLAAEPEIAVPEDAPASAASGSPAPTDTPPPPALPGPALEIVSRADGLDAHIDVRSEALGRLDPATADRGLRYRVLRAKTPDGPFEPRGAFDVFADAPVEALSDEDHLERIHAPARTGKDRVCLFARVDEEEGSEEHAVFWYRVSEVAIAGRRDPTEDGEPALSNVVGPGAPELRVRAPLDADGAVRVASFDRSVDSTVLAMLGWSGQAYAAWNAEFTVTGEFGTRRFWSGRVENGRSIAYATHANADARIEIPAPPRGTTVRISASAPGMTASTTVRIAADAKQMEMLEKRLLDAQRLREERITKRAETAEADRLALEKRADPRGEPPRDASDASMSAWIAAAVDHVTAKRGYRMSSEVIGPHEEAEERRADALGRSRYAEAVVAARDAVKAAVRIASVERQYHEAMDEILPLYDKISEPEAFTLEQARKVREHHAWQKQRSESWTVRFQAEAWERLGEAAFAAGDVLALREAIDSILELYVEAKDSGGLQRAYAQAARWLAVVPGDRAEAADYLRRSLDLELSRPEMTEDQRAARVESFWRNLPAWWPEGEVPPR